MSRRLGVISAHLSDRPTLALSKSRSAWVMRNAMDLPAPKATNPRSLKGKTLFVSGASRGIGLAIAKRAAQDGANVVIAAKTTTPDPRLPGTIFTAAEEVLSTPPF
jgi:citronellol/citronellal dehydrogenase